MRINTLVKKYFFYLLLVNCLIGLSNVVYAQCPTVVETHQTFCDTQSPTVGSLVATDTGGGIKWYTTAVGGTALSNSISLIDGSTYYVDDTTGSCGTRVSVLVTIYSKPTAVLGSIQFCQASTVADLAPYVIGNQIKWYATPTGGAVLASSTPLVNGTTYYASQTNPNTGCETSRKGFSVNITIVPTPTGTSNPLFCANPLPLVADLNANGTNLLWYSTPTSGIELDSLIPLVDGQTYYAESNIGNCPSPTRLSVTVSISQPNNAGTSGTMSVCEEAISTTVPFDLFGQLGGTPDTTGVWTGPIGTSNGYQGTVDITSLNLAGSPYVFTYTVTTATACPPDFSTVTLTIIQTPTASVSFDQTTICANDSAALIFTGTPNATVTYTINGGSNLTIVLDATGTATVVGAYTIDTTVTLVSVTTAGLPSCTKVLNQTITLTVLDPTASASFDQTTICANDSATLTFTGTPNATVTYTINGGANQTIVLDAAGTATLVGTYTTDTTVVLVSVTTAGLPSCTKILNQTITLTVLDPTASVSFDQTTICANDSATLTFTGTPNATVTYTINGGANQTIVLDATGTATVVGTYTTDTTVVLVSVTTAGLPSCTKILNQTITLTILDPTASASFDQTTICANDSATLTFTGTPNATVTYTINGGANQTIVLDATGTATLVGTYTTDTTVVLVSVTTSGLPSCTKILNQTITLTVLDPTASASFDQTTICANDSATLTFTGTPNATVTYTINGGANQTIVLDAAGTATLVGTYTTDTTVVLVSVTTAGLPSCTKILNQTITLTVLDPTASASFDQTTICANDSAALIFTGTPNATVTYSINGGSNLTIVLDATGTATVVGAYTVDTTVTLVSVTTAGLPSCTKILNQSITLTILDPTASASFDQTTICANDSATLTFIGTPNATVTYTINGGANQTIVLDATGTATVVGTYTVDTTVTLVSVTTAGLPSCTKVLNQTITLTVLDPTASASFDQTSICANDSATLTFTGTPNATVTYTINGGANQTIVLDAAGTATLIGTYTTDTTVVLVSVTTAGLPSCTKLLNQTITLTVLDPTASVSFDQTTICANDSAALIFTGTPNATVTYTINGGSNLTIVLDATGTATVVGAYTIDTTVTLVSVTTAGLPSCTKILNQTITLTVLDPTASASFDQTTICANDSATLTFIGTPNATVTYTINGGANQTIVLDATGTATLVGTYTTDTTVVIVSVTTAGLPSCTKILNQTITLTVLDPTASASFDQTTICANDSATLTFTGTPNATVTYTINGGANQTIVLDATGTATVVGTYTSDTTVTLVSVTTAGLPSCTKILNQTITLTVLDPTASASFDQATICENDSAALTFTGTPNATVTYTINGGANLTIPLDAAGTAIVIGAYTTDTTVVLVSVTTTGVPSCTKVLNQTITLTVNPKPDAGVSPAPQTVCQSGAAFDMFDLLGPTAQVGGTWLPALASGTGIFDPSIDVSNTYVYTVTGIAPCVSASASVQVLVTPVPDAGDDTNVPLCSNQNPVDLNTYLSATAQPGGVWTDPSNAVVSSILDPSTAAEGDYTYTVTGIAPCADDTAILNVTITPGPEAGQSGTFSICVGSVAHDLFLELGPNAQPGGTWSPAMASGTGFFDPAVDAATTYTYTLTGLNPCDNDQATLDVQVLPMPDAGTDGNAAICSNSIPIDLFSYLNGTPQAGGVWTDAGGTVVSAMYDPTVQAAGVFTYAVSAGFGCSPATSLVTVSLLPTPIAGVDGNLAVCSDSTGLDLINGLDGTQEAGTFSDDDATGALSGTVFDPSQVSPGIYHFTYTVSGGVAPCFTDTAVVTVTVTALPNAGVFVPTSPLCPSVGTIDLTTLLSGQDSGGLWYDTNTGDEIVNPVDISAFAPGIYLYDYVVSNDCGSSDPTTVIFEVLPFPQMDTTNVSIAPVCVGTDVLVSLSGMVDAPYTLTYDLSGSTNLTNQTALVNVVGGLADFTIPAATFTTSGSTAITFTAIQNNDTTCQIALNSVTGVIVINPAVQLDSANLSVGTLCFGNDVTVSINSAVNLPDGVYQMDYSLTGATTANGNSGSITITGGVGSFTIPAATFVSGGTTTVTILTIITATGCSNMNEDAAVSFDLSTGLNAGVFAPISPLCASAGTVDLFDLLTGEDINGVWTDSASLVVTSPITISSFAAGTYFYTYTVTNTCGTQSQTVQFTVSSNPDLTPANITIPSVCMGSDVVVNLTGMADGTYALNYDLTGTTTLAGQTATVTIASGVGTFSIPAAPFTSVGTTTISFTSIQNTVTGCQTVLTSVTGTIVVNPVVQLDSANLTIASLCLGSAATVTIANATSLPDGDYQFNYTLSGANTGTANSGTVTITAGAGSFVIPSASIGTIGTSTITINSIISATLCSNMNEDAATTFTVVGAPNAGVFTGLASYCTSVGVLDLGSLLTGEDSTGVWTDSAAQVVTSPLTILSFNAGTYSYTYTVTNACGTQAQTIQFTILPTPKLLPVQVAVPSVCVGSNAVVNLTGMTDGIYTIHYDLAGTNLLAGQQAVVAVAGGVGNFAIPSASIPLVGSTLISFTSIVDAGTNCLSLLNFSSNLVVKPLAHIDATSVAIPTVCLGTSSVVTLTNAIDLPDDTYQFSYSIPGANPSTGTTGNVVLTSGSGSFTLPASIFTVAGNYTMTITAIAATTGCSNLAENTAVPFSINALPDTTGATMSIAAICFANDATVTLAGAIALTDGNYTLQYALSGANTSASNSATVTIASGQGSFNIPAALLPTAGTTTVTITLVTSATSTCSVVPSTVLAADVTPTVVDEPTLIVDYNLCQFTNPTVANLTMIVSGTLPVVWYTSLTGGTAYSATDVLVPGTTYYAAYIGAGGCESVTRMPFDYVLNGCEVVIPDGFSPNDDGTNDTFEIANIGLLYPKYKIEIYNRYGNRVYQGDINTPNWAGVTTESGLKFGDNIAPTGVYFYIVYFNDSIKKPVQGSVYLSR